MIQLEMTMRSVALDMDTKVMMFLPEDRHKTEDKRGKTYPVLYVLHGMKEDNSSWIALSNLFLMCRDLDLIVVMPAVQK
ncbi:MAG: transcriptional antiterminator, partial [Erysipelotrichaceae bacterium]|nr:transcriptional antiterminator [Erysipelotrichaceae bacterium]